MDFTISLDAHQKSYRYKYLALYHAIRTAIHEGTLRGGTRLPSSRELAEQYSLSRGSVAQAYDMLQAEGYVYSLVGSGTYVADIIPNPEVSRSQSASITLSSWGRRVMELDVSSSNELHRGKNAEINKKRMISFQDSGPLMSAFPYKEWKSALAWATRESSDSLSMPPDPAGDIELRQAIAAHLRRSRGIAAEADQICLFNGSMQAIMLLTQLLLSEGEPAVLENPCYHGFSKAVSACGGVAVPAEVDAGGIVPRDWDARLLFVTPGRQFPTGAVLSPARRAEILSWAARVNAVIIEDDYDSEFRWRGRRLEPLKALDSEDRVVYIGSFSKTMFASLRIGYAVLPRGIVVPLSRSKELYEPVSSARIEQRALAKFMFRGEYDRHLRRMRRIYGAKHELFRRLMEKEGMTSLFDLKSADAGLLVYAPWKHSPEQYQDFLHAAYNRDVQFRDAAMYQLGTGSPAACFSLSHLEEYELKEGVFRLTMAWRDIQK
ncbi:HTH-type transcriptional regulatory protein GabR [compost metagenome]